MSAPQRLSSGVINRSAKHPLGLAGLPFLDPTLVQVFFDDFHSFVVAAANITGWHQDADGSPTGATVQDAAGGVIMLKPGGTSTNNVQYQWGTNTAVHEPFKLVPGKRAWLRTRFKIEDADQNIPMIGMHIAADDPWNSEPTDQFLFRTLAATPAGLQFACGKTNSTEVTIALGDLADDTYVIVTAYYDGKDTVMAWRQPADDGAYTVVGSASVTSSTRGDLLPDTEMTAAFGAEAVDDGTDELNLDYILIALER